MELKPIILDNKGKLDSLDNINLQTGFASLSNIKAMNYPALGFKIKFVANSDNQSPVFQSLKVNYTGQPELGTNYQVVSVSSDTLMQGELQNLLFYVYNVGEFRADNIKVRVEISHADNSREKIFEEIVDSLGSEQRKQFKLSYNTSSISGNKNFIITIDPENEIGELYKDNNVFVVPFYVKVNSAPASIRLTIDGKDILNGDFISSNPNIKIELDDYSLIPIVDTNAVQILLNSKRVSYTNNFINYTFSNSNPKFSINYNPVLTDGEYTLSVFGENATGTSIDSLGLTKKFLVNTAAQLLNVYNYPNPISDDTYFTFKLTQIPDELTIKIFTVAGRLIKEIKKYSSELNYDFNRIYWDGRDGDGGLIGNGVYLYKIHMKKGEKSIEAINKLAVVR